MFSFSAIESKVLFSSPISFIGRLAVTLVSRRLITQSAVVSAQNISSTLFPMLQRLPLLAQMLPRVLLLLPLLPRVQLLLPLVLLPVALRGCRCRARIRAAIGRKI